ncbi:hypothetical protein G9A89_013339 [Geosiphon pyriformis]|nr:hypothetical protein G9A89_013339 [Geosiphon pyriformis]
MSGPSVKRRSARVSTTGSVGGDLGHKIKKLSSGTKFSSSDAILKSGGSGRVVRQFNDMDTDGEASKAKCFNNSATVGSPLGSINYDMEEEKEVSPPPHKSFSLDKVWVDPKIIKTQVKVTMKKSFALDINLLAVERKLATAKTQVIRKLFSGINGFGGATTPSKFEGIIRSTFMSEKNMERAASLTRKKGIIVNSDLKRQEICSDRTIIIKKIPMDTPKGMIITAVTEFGEIKSIHIQLVGLWQKAVVEFAKLEQAVQLASKWSFLIRKDLVHMTMAVGDCKTWTSRDQFRALLFTLPVGTTAHNFGNLLKETDKKTCIINQSFETGNRICCAVVGFDSEEKLEAAFCTEPIFGSVRLSWARLGLVQCEKCGRFEHSVLECDASDVSVPAPSIALKKERHVFSVDRFHLAKLYVKKNVSISHSAAFGGKSWAQVVSLASSAGGSPSNSGFGFGPSLSGASDLVGSAPSSPIDESPLDAQLASLERSLELLADQVSGILRKLNFVELVPMVPSSNTLSLVGSVPMAPVLDSDMVLDGTLTLLSPSLSNVELDAGFSSSSSKVLTTKVGGLKSKMSALKALVGSVLARLDLLCSDLVRLLFKGKLSVTVLGLYAGASLGVHFRQASEVNSFIAKAVNASNFVVLDGDFNKNESGRSHWVGSVSEFFDTDHKAVMVSVGLGRLLDVQLNSLCKQANKNRWKFKIKDADASKWSEFRNCVSAKLLLIKDFFSDAKAGGDLDTM